MDLRLRCLVLFISASVIPIEIINATPSYITPNRPTEIRFAFPHLTTFEDMNDPRCRAQRMGIQTSGPFPDPTNVTVWNNVYADLRRIVRIYFDVSNLFRDNNITDIRYYQLLKSTIVSTGKRDGSDVDFFMKPLLMPLNEIIQDSWRSRPSIIMLITYLEQKLVEYGKSSHIHIMKAWKTFFLFALSSNPTLLFKQGNAKLKLSDSYNSPSSIHDDWSLVFIDEVCKLELIEVNLTLPVGFCPNPCLTHPCSSIPYTSSFYCYQTGTRWFDFYCECQPNFQWVQAENSQGYCKPNAQCTGYCNSEGTRRCDVIDFKEFCVCRPSHMGPTCSVKRDPCLELSGPDELPGNISCNTANGGKCIPEIGTNTYSCICPSAYTSDPSYSLPNCLAFKDNCLSRICLQGDCISSKDGQETYCLCPDEAYGDYCELIRGKWAQWSPWSECTPNCGLTEYQRRIRTRDCLGEACRGGEGHLQMEMCPTMPCPDETLALARQGRSEEAGELKIQLLQAQAARYVKLVGAVAQALLLITGIFVATAATAMTISVHLL